MKNCLLLGAAVVGLSGCATVINGTSQDVAVRSDPSGAEVTITNGTECVTPCELNLKRRHDLRVDFKRDGYKPAYVLVQSRTGGAVAGNLLLGGVIGGVVDSANGATNTLYPQPVSVKLAPVGSAEETMLLDKKGKVIGTVASHNDAVRADVAKTIGAEAAGSTMRQPRCSPPVRRIPLRRSNHSLPNLVNGSEGLRPAPPAAP